MGGNYYRQTTFQISTSDGGDKLTRFPKEGSATFVNGGAGGWGGGGQGGGSSHVRLFEEVYKEKIEGQMTSTMFGGGGGGGGYSGGRGGTSFRDCSNYPSSKVQCKSKAKGTPKGGGGGGGGSLIAATATNQRKEKGVRFGNGYVKIQFID